MCVCMCACVMCMYMYVCVCSFDAHTAFIKNIPRVDNIEELLRSHFASVSVCLIIFEHQLMCVVYDVYDV